MADIYPHSIFIALTKSSAKPARIAARIDIPFTVGGGISSVEDAGRLLDAGADKVTVNSAAVRNPALIDAIAARYGSQFVVAAIDARQVDGRWVVTTHGGKRPLSYRLADYYGVGKGIEELEQIASDHRTREAKQHGKRISLSQIDCHITPSWPRHACALCS